VEKRRVFLDDRDRGRFLELLGQYQAKFGFTLLAYCLMSNHVHLAARTGKKPLRLFLHSLLGAYALGFNRRHGRVGHLFADRYKALLIEQDRYLLTVVRYIHANPVRAGMVDRPEAFRWSSDRAYRFGPVPPWLDASFVLRILDDSVDAAREAYRALSILEEPAALPPAHSDVVAGSRSFARAALSEAAHETRLADLSVPDLARLVAEREGVSWRALLRPRGEMRVVRARALTAFAANRVGRVPAVAVARFFGLAPSSLTRGIRALERSVPETVLRRQVDEVLLALCSGRAGSDLTQNPATDPERNAKSSD
jgi:REP element-mobilizing transposase RayT